MRRWFFVVSLMALTPLARGEPLDPALDSLPGAPIVSPAVEEPRQTSELPDLPWLRPWDDPARLWSIAPLAGAKYTQEYDGDDRIHASAWELGLSVRQTGVPLWSGNPGLFLEGGILGAWGERDRWVVMSDDQLRKKDSAVFRRVYGDIGLVWLNHWFRQEINFSRGRKDFFGQGASPTQSAGLRADSAAFLLRNWSQHYTFRLTRGHTDRWETRSLLDQDHWVHARVFDLEKTWFIDFGPGHTVTRIYLPAVGVPSTDLLAHGQSDYVRVVSGARLLWKIGVSADAKYVYAATDSRLGEFAPPLLPEDALTKTPTVAQPRDSLFASAFAGARDLVYGLGIGWQMNWQCYHWQEVGGRRQVITRDHGLAVTVKTDF